MSTNSQTYDNYFAAFAVKFLACVWPFCGDKLYKVIAIESLLKNKLTDKGGLILILDTVIDDIEFIPIDSFRASAESEQLNTFGLKYLFSNLELTYDKHLILFGDFNRGSSLEAKMFYEQISWNERTIWYLENRIS